jgi:hypothetical protein
MRRDRRLMESARDMRTTSLCGVTRPSRIAFSDCFIIFWNPGSLSTLSSQRFASACSFLVALSNLRIVEPPSLNSVTLLQIMART